MERDNDHEAGHALAETSGLGKAQGQRQTRSEFASMGPCMDPKNLKDVSKFPGPRLGEWPVLADVCLAAPSGAALQGPASSQRDTQITPPSQLFSGKGGKDAEKDEYLLNLLSKGRPAAAPLPAAPPAAFRAPDPVPPRPAAGPRPSNTGPATASGAGDKPAPAPLQLRHRAKRAALGPSQQHRPTSSSTFTLADSRRAIGAEAAEAVRATIVRQQVRFIEQVYDLHRAVAVQRLLVRNCPDVDRVVAAASRLMASASCQGPAGAAQVGTAAAGPGGLRPDSQFAAVPHLPGDTATAGGSGEGDGSGSGGHGSGGGSTSPQPQAGVLPGMFHPPPQAPLQTHPPPTRVRPLGAAPSGASATWAVGFSPATAPQHMGWGPAPIGMFPMVDPMAWWYQQYYGQASKQSN
jgi:hypothetical protein